MSIKAELREAGLSKQNCQILCASENRMCASRKYNAPEIFNRKLQCIIYIKMQVVYRDKWNMHYQSNIHNIFEPYND